MVRLASDDDRRAVLHRLERHGVRDGPTQTPTPTPRVSPRLITAVFVVLGLCLLAVWAPWRSHPAQLELPAANTDLPTADAQDFDHEAEPQPSYEPEPSPDEERQEETVTVNVVGQVKDAGVHTLPAGARVIDAIEAAGGALPEADLSRLNLARILGDEEYVAVLAAGEDPPQLLGPQEFGLPGGGLEAQNSAGSGQPGGGEQINLNTASEEQLQTLPGVGPVMAGRIAAWRAEHGGFRSIDELHEVSGIGPKVFAQLAPLVTI